MFLSYFFFPTGSHRWLSRFPVSVLAFFAFLFSTRKSLIVFLIVLETLFVGSLLELGYRKTCIQFFLVLGDIKILDYLESSSASEGPFTNQAIKSGLKI